MKRIFVGQNVREPVNYLSFLPDGNAMNFLLWKVLTAKVKSVHVFFYKQLNCSFQPQVAKSHYSKPVDARRRFNA